MKLDMFLDKQEQLALVQEGHLRQQVEVDFVWRRDGMISAYCELIRLHDKTKRRNAAFPHKPCVTGEDLPNREYCNAAVHILACAPEDIQRFFLASDFEIRKRMIDAVIADGGIETLSGQFVELPK